MRSLPPLSFAVRPGALFLAARVTSGFLNSADKANIIAILISSNDEQQKERVSFRKSRQEVGSSCALMKGSAHQNEELIRSHTGGSLFTLKIRQIFVRIPRTFIRYLKWLSYCLWRLSIALSVRPDTRVHVSCRNLSVAVVIKRRKVHTYPLCNFRFHRSCNATRTRFIVSARAVIVNFCRFNIEIIRSLNSRVRSSDTHHLRKFGLCALPQYRCTSTTPLRHGSISWSYMHNF